MKEQSDHRDLLPGTTNKEALQAERRARRDKGSRLMNSRDRQLLHWIGEQYAVRFDHLHYLLSLDPRPRNPATLPGPQGITTSAVTQVVRRWTQEPPWARYERIHTDEPGWIWTTSSGLEHVGLHFASYTLKRNTLTHMHWINCLRIDIERRYPSYRWVSERTLRAMQLPKERGKQSAFLPDAQIWTPEHQAIAVEVELSPKRIEEVTTRLQALLYQQQGTGMSYAAVWYFVSQASQENRDARHVVESARSNLSEAFQERVQVIALEPLLPVPLNQDEQQE